MPPDIRSIFKILEPPKSLSDCCSPWDIAKFLDLEYEELSALLYPNTLKSYSSFTIPKKSGAERAIDAPIPKLAKLQSTLKDDLSKYYKPMPCAHGFITNRSIKSNALIHIKKRFVFNIDLKDFFGSVHFGRVKNLFLKAPFNLDHATATVVAQLCCHQNKLPQGAATSPIITNMICLKLDRELQRLAKEYRCHVSRYADDITFSFSCSKVRLPKAIIQIKASDETITVGDKLTKLIKSNGFEINKSKVRLKGQHQRQEVTGLVVNDHVNIKREFIQQTKSMLYAWEKHGLIPATSHYMEKYKKKDLAGRYRKTNHLYFTEMIRGRVNFVRMVKGANNSIYKTLAYRYFKLIGRPNEELLKNDLVKAIDCTFIIENHDENEMNCGTAFLLEGYGLITNHHVIKLPDYKNLDLLHLHQYNNIKTVIHPANCIGLFEKSDLAMFTINDPEKKYKSLLIGNPSEIKVNSQVTIIGYPDYSLGDEPRVTHTEVIGTKKFLGVKIFLVEKNIYHGNSGGPVLNSNFEVIGIATNGGSIDSGGSSINGFIPISELTSLAKG